MTIPQKRESPLAGGQFTNESNNQPILTGSKPPTKYVLIWGAAVRPPMAKFVLVALANYSDADGTNIRPSITTIARQCGLSTKQARRHVQALETCKILHVTRTVPGRPTVYAINLQILHELTPPAHGRGIKGQPLPPMGVHPSHGREYTPPTHGSQPYLDPDEVRGEEREGGKPPPPPGAGSALPPGVDMVLWQKVAEINPKRNMAAIGAAAREYLAAGVPAETITTELVEMTKAINAYKVRFSLRLPRVPVTRTKRTTARLGALVNGPGFNTRPPGGTDYSPQWGET